MLVVAFGFLALAFSYSARAILGLVMPIWEWELGWARSDVSGIAAITLVIMAIVAPISGMLLDRSGLRITLLTGLVAVCATSLFVSVANSTFALLLAFGVLGGVGFGIVSTHIVAAAVARVFPNHVGFASGIATSGSTAGQFIIVPAIAFLISGFNWQVGFIAMGLATAVLIPFLWFVPDDPPENINNDLKNDETQSTGYLSDCFALLRSKVFHLLFWSYVICGYTTTGVIETHLLPYAQLCGFAPVPSATAYGLLSVFNLIGMIVIGWLADRMNRPLLLGAIYIVRGVTFWMLLNIGASYENLIIFAVIFGIVDYSTVPVTTSLVSSHLGIERVGFVMGLLTAGHQLGAAAGAGFGGYLFEQTQAYDLVWISSLALAVIAGILVLLLRENPVAPRTMAN